MYQVMIVDDEPFIRFGIQASVDWEKQGMHVAGQYANGEEALKAMTHQAVDILITDIKMPLMDGLILTRKAIELNPGLKVVLVSSYNDFEYVREGIRLGAIDYILKPTMEPEELLLIMQKCVSLIDQDRSLRQELSAYQKVSKEQKRRGLEQQLKRFMAAEEGELEKTDWTDWLEPGFTTVCIHLNQAGEITENHGFIHQTILLEDMREICYEMTENAVALVADDHEMLLLLPFSENVLEQLERIKMKIESDLQVSTTIGYFCANGGDLREGFAKSQTACSRKFFEGSERIYDFKGANCDLQKELRFSSASLQSIHWQDPAQLEPFLAGWAAEREQAGLNEQRIKLEACELISALFTRQLEWSHLQEVTERLIHEETLQELKEKLAGEIAECMRWVEGNNARRAGHPSMMSQALDYIHRHFAEELTLQQVADSVFISKNYFSILFKKHTQQNFIDYVIQLRIQQAKTLLEDVRLKIYEVAAQSGFNDVKYFSKLFKKMTGSSPMEYRNGFKGNME